MGRRPSCRRNAPILGIHRWHVSSFLLALLLPTLTGCEAGTPLQAPFWPENEAGDAAMVRPDAVQDLKVVATRPSGVTLSFRDVNDGTGNPASYDMRFKRAPLEHAWGSATSVTEGSCAAPLRGTKIGELRTCTVRGLKSGTRYEFQLVPYRGTLNHDAVFGKLSNIAPGETERVSSGSGGSGGSGSGGSGGSGSDGGTAKPTGFAKITERSFRSRNEAGWRDENLSIVSEGSARVATFRFDRGFSDGRAPGRTTAPRFAHRNVYASFRLKFSSNWQGHDSGVNKIAYLTDQAEGRAGDPVYFAAFGTGSGQLHFQVRTQGPDLRSRNLKPNLGRGELRRGTWHRVEVLVTMNRPGRSDGEVHVWIDGRKTHQYRDVRLATGGTQQRFDNFRWNPVWGGSTGDVVRQNMYQRMSHVYLGGK